MKELVKFGSFLDLLREYNTEEKCRAYLAEIRWGGKPKCPHCKSDQIWTYSNRKTYKCKSCTKQFHVLNNSVFQGTHIKLQDWFYVMYIMANHNTGINAKQVAKDLRITPKSALFLLNRIREAMRDREGKLFGEIEVDETFVGGKNKNRHPDKKVRNAQGRSLKDKAGIYGFVERGGRVRTVHLRKMRGKGMRLILKNMVDLSSTVFSDEYNNYNGLGRIFKSHRRVNHGQGQYVDGDVHTNTIESFWSSMKGGITSTYRSVSKKRIFRYCYEFEFRWNTRFEPDDENFVRLLSQTFGKRLTYAMATAPDRSWARL